MKGLIELTVRLIRAGKRAYERKWSFFGVFVGVFLGSVFVLGQMGLLPQAPPPDAAQVLPVSSIATVQINTLASSTISELPAKIEIPAINLSASIANPTTTDVAVLDRDLLKGAVRYPTSAELNQTGNVVLFGHSSYLPIVGNQAYKTFDGIQKLVAGDVVTVSSAGTAYTYRVRSVAKESAASNAGIDLAVSGQVLTLVTCNSFETKSDRFILTADFVESHPIASQG